MVAQEVKLVAQHRGVAEVIGVGAFVVDHIGSGLQIAECGDVAACRKAQHRDVGRAQMRRVAKLLATTKIHIDKGYDATKFFGVDNSLGVEA